MWNENGQPPCGKRKRAIEGGTPPYAPDPGNPRGHKGINCKCRNAVISWWQADKTRTHRNTHNTHTQRHTPRLTHTPTQPHTSLNTHITLLGSLLFLHFWGLVLSFIAAHYYYTTYVFVPGGCCCYCSCSPLLSAESRNNNNNTTDAYLKSQFLWRRRRCRCCCLCPVAVCRLYQLVTPDMTLPLPPPPLPTCYQLRCVSRSPLSVTCYWLIPHTTTQRKRERREVGGRPGCNLSNVGQCGFATVSCLHSGNKQEINVDLFIPQRSSRRCTQNANLA